MRNTSMIASTRRQLSTTPTGRPVPGAHPLKQGPAVGYAGTGGAGQYPPPRKSSGGGKTLPLVALVAVLGIGAYYATMDDPEAAAKRDARRLEAGAKHEVDALRSGARSSSAPLVDASGTRRELDRAKDAVSSDHKSWTDSLRLGGGSNTSDEAHLASRAQNVVDDVKDTAKGWGRSLRAEKDSVFHGHGEGVKAEILRWKEALKSPDGKMGVEQVEEYLRSKGHYTTTLEPYPLFDLFGTAPSLRKTQVETSLGRYEREGENFINSTLNKASAEYEKAKAAAKNLGRDAKSYGEDLGRDARSLGQDAKSETKSWFNWGEKKASNEYYSAKADAKDAANSVSNAAEDARQGVANAAHDARRGLANATEDVRRTVSDATYDARTKVDDATRNAIPVAAESLRAGYDKVESSARSAYNSAAGAANDAYETAAAKGERAANEASRAANNAEAKAKAEGRSWFSWGENKAEDAKNSVKSGLLSAEQSVEHGAQRAQQETRKL
ncbi:hypothetical protein JCM10212_006923 [Sporobolomyces blumeae]